MFCQVCIKINRKQKQEFRCLRKCLKAVTKEAKAVQKKLSHTRGYVLQCHLKTTLTQLTTDKHSYMFEVSMKLLKIVCVHLHWKLTFLTNNFFNILHECMLKSVLDVSYIIVYATCLNSLCCQMKQYRYSQSCNVIHNCYLALLNDEIKGMAKKKMKQELKRLA